MSKQHPGDVMAISKTVSGAELNSGYADNPDHKVKVEPAAGRFTVRAGGTAVVEADEVLVLFEANYPPVFYFAPDTVDFTALRRTAHTTWCPFKGRASYYSIGDDPAFENAVWTYDDPFEEVGAIKGYLAFYSNKVAVSVLEDQGCN